jgi:hypothetical protein
MNSNRILLAAAVVLLALVSSSCKESLPGYADPKNVMAFKVTLIEQLNDRLAPPGRQVVHFVLEAENIHDEVFFDSVNIQGSVRIWWKRRPFRFRTMTLTKSNLQDRDLIRNGKIMLLPGQKVSFDVFWNVRTDDGIYLPREMNFAFLRRRVCDFNVACADPEEFVVESSMKMYDRLGVIQAATSEFTFIGRVCVCSAFPPCSAGGGC